MDGKRHSLSSPRLICLAVGLSVLALAIQGCVNQSKEVAKYRSVVNGKSPAVTYSPEQPLSLSAAMLLAGQNNEQLAIQGEQYLQAMIDKDRAAARFVPTVSLAPLYVRQEQTQLVSGPFADFVPPKALDVPVNAGMNFNAPADAANIKRAGAVAQAQQQTLLNAKATLLLDVARVYYEVLLSQRQAEVFGENAGVQEVLVRDTQTRYDAGAALEKDVAQAQAQLAGIKASLARASADVRNGRATLAYLIGVDSVDGELTDDIVVPEEVADEDALVEQAFGTRSDLKAAHDESQAAVAVLNAAWSEYFPSVSLDLTYYTKRQSFPSDVLWMGAISADLPIFSAGLIHANVRTAYSRLRQANLAESLLSRQIRRDIRVARENLMNSRVIIENVQQEVQAGGVAFDQSDVAYRNGAATQLDRLVSHQQLLQAELRLASDELSQTLYYLELLRNLDQLGPETIMTTSAEPEAAASQPATAASNRQEQEPSSD